MFVFRHGLFLISGTGVWRYLEGSKLSNVPFLIEGASPNPSKGGGQRSPRRSQLKISETCALWVLVAKI